MQAGNEPLERGRGNKLQDAMRAAQIDNESRIPIDPKLDKLGFDIIRTKAYFHDPDDGVGGVAAGIAALSKQAPGT
jgi:hypothetical protein